MTSEDGDMVVNSSSYLFNLDDDDGYEDLLGTQIPNENPDLPLLDLDEDFPGEAMEHSAPQDQRTVCQLQQAGQPPRQTVEVQATEACRQRPPAKIPENIEIISLDALETDSSRGIAAGQVPQISIKSEDVIFYNTKSSAIKREESETAFRWGAIPEKLINLVDSDDESNKNRLNNTQATVIKQEHKEEWTWAAMQRGQIIELSDSDDDTVVELPPTISPNASKQAESLTQNEQTQQVDENSSEIGGSNATTAFTHNGSVLQVPNVKAKRTVADRAKLLQLQKIYAERALGRKVVAGAGNIFKGTQGHAGNAPAEAENDLAWMNDAAEMNDNADAATQFALIKAKYNRKKRARRNTFEDDVLFMKADSAEKARLKRLEDDYRRDRGPIYSEDLENTVHSSEDELFVRQSPPRVTPSLKRPHTATVQSDDVDHRNPIIVESDANESDPEAYVTRKPQSKRQRAKELEKELQDSMLAGIEMDMVKDRKKAKKSGKGLANEKSDGSKHRKGRSKGTKNKDPGAGVRRTKSKKGKDTSKKPRPTEAGYLNNFNSLFTSNVYEDVNANLSLPSLNVDGSLVKEQALKSLLAGVPLDDLNKARQEKQHILKATRTLGARKVKADGKGGWKFTGMTCSLYNHQIQGAAWMRERETGDVEPLGGLQADEMGLGKTIMTIACMVSNPPAPGSSSNCTLIVSTPALVTQWESELRKHTEAKVFPTILIYHGKEFTRTYTRDAERQVQMADIVLTSYQEVWKSYPKYRPPKHIVLPEKKKEWWTEAYKANRSILHRVHFHRIVLDEAQIIKNHESQISIACRGLMGKHRWAISGTPIQNRVEEFFPFFKFLRVPYTGTVEVFKENFADPENDDSNSRLHSFLKQFMIRRTHANKLFGSALVELPRNTQKTVIVEFNKVERAIYDAVQKRYIQKINRNSRNGELEKSYSNILTMLLRLRQLTAHPFMLQQTIEDLFELEDIERLWALTASEVTADDNKARDMLLTMKKIIAEKDKPADPNQTEPNHPETLPVEDPSGDPAAGESIPLVFKFRRFLRDLAESYKWNDLEDRSLCHKCRDSPDDPWVTSCLHVYCKECINALAYEAAERNEEETACLECGNIYTESGPCNGLKELQLDAEGSSGMTPENGAKPVRRARRDPEQDLKWINFEGSILPSSKTAAVQAQIEMWLKNEPDKKIIVFSQFHMLMKILGRMFQQRGWSCVNYHGKMSHEARDAVITTFRDDPNTKIMVASLKCGGVGLNLTMASRVICVDLWWNSSVEQQAFCRVLRIGQDHETFITRLVVKNTVDERLQNMQDSKQEKIGAAIDDSKMLDKLSLEELMRLFGPVKVGEDRRPFILVDEDIGEDAMPHGS